jgi:hypothetical protein
LLYDKSKEALLSPHSSLSLEAIKIVKHPESVSSKNTSRKMKAI